MTDRQTALVVPAVLLAMILPAVLLCWSPQGFVYVALGVIGLFACGALYLAGGGLGTAIREQRGKARQARRAQS